MTYEESDSFLTKEEAEKEFSLVMLVSEYILEQSPRMPMSSQGEMAGVLRDSRETLRDLGVSSVSRKESVLDCLLRLLEDLLAEDDLCDDCPKLAVLEFLVPLRKEE
jgi:hypothetical protein